MHDPLFVVACGYLAGILEAGDLTFEDLEYFLDNDKPDAQAVDYNDKELEYFIKQSLSVLLRGVVAAASRSDPVVGEDRIQMVADKICLKISYGKFNTGSVARLCGCSTDAFLVLLEMPGYASQAVH